MGFTIIFWTSWSSTVHFWMFLVGFFQPQVSHCKYPIIIYRWWSPITLQIILRRLFIVRERVDFDPPHFFPTKNCTGYSSMTDWAPREIVVFSLGPVHRVVRFFLFPPGGYDAEAGGFGAWESWDFFKGEVSKKGRPLIFPMGFLWFPKKPSSS